MKRAEVGTDGRRDPAPLLGREGPLAALDDQIDAARREEGTALLLEGPAGIGKTSLLDEAAGRARDRGVRVLRAAGEALAGTTPWGVASQLFAGVVEGPGADGLLDGPARGGLTAIDGAPGDGAEAFPIVHGLFRLTANLAEREPLLVLVDDAHWADPPSMRFVAFLARRLQDLPVSVVVTRRPASGDAVDEVVDGLAADASTRVWPLPPLEDRDIRAIVAREAPGATEAFCRAVETAVAGNPLLCREVARAAHVDGVATRPDVVDLPLGGVRHSVLVRLAQVGPAAPAVAGAVAILSPWATIRRIAALGSMGVDEVAAVVDALAAADVVRVDGDVVAFVHPITGEVVISDLGSARARRDHEAAARLLHAEGAPAGQVAAHLMRCGPPEEGWVVEVLRRAGLEALQRGAPDEAVAILRPALDAAPGGRARAEVLLDLGRAEAAAGEPAVEHLREALGLLPEAAGDAGLALALGEALYASGRFPEAVEAFEHGLDLLDPGRRGEVVEARLLNGLTMATMLASGLTSRARDRTEALVADPPARPTMADRVLLAAAAGELAFGVTGCEPPAAPPRAAGFHVTGRGAPTPSTRDRVMALVDVVDPECGLEGADAAVLLESVTLPLVLCDELRRARALLDRALADAAGSGAIASYTSLLAIRAMCALLQGSLADAIADARHTIDLTGELPAANGRTVAAAHRALVQASLLVGDRATAEWAVDVPDAAERLGATPLHGWYLDAVGRVALDGGDPATALDAFLTAGERFSAAGGSGAYCDWRSGAARAALALGDRDRAVGLAEEEHALAVAFGAARPVAGALRARAAVAADADEAVALLTEAHEVIDGSEAELTVAEVAVDLGAALRRSGRRRDARTRLREGFDVASRCGATRLVARAEDELEASGARRPSRATTGLEALTPSERRVARMAAQGRSNPEIADGLFVSRKTVEVHLSSVYRKLGIGSRRELPAELTR